MIIALCLFIAIITALIVYACVIVGARADTKETEEIIKNELNRGTNGKNDN